MDRQLAIAHAGREQTPKPRITRAGQLNRFKRPQRQDVSILPLWGERGQPRKGTNLRPTDSRYSINHLEKARLVVIALFHPNSQGIFLGKIQGLIRRGVIDAPNFTSIFSGSRNAGHGTGGEPIHGLFGQMAEQVTQAVGMICRRVVGGVDE